VKELMNWNSTCATSGAPCPDWIAVLSFWWCGAPCPTLTTFTFILGYLVVNSFTSLVMSGTQVQNVNVVGVSIALSMSAWGI